MRISIITPTGDRPECIALLSKWIANQTIKPSQWVIVDDGVVPLKPIKGAKIIRREKVKGVTLGANLDAALDHVTGDYILIMEDDDYYAPQYIARTIDMFDDDIDMVGWHGSPYYNVALPGYRVMGDEKHASLSQTAFTRKMIPFVRSCIPGAIPAPFSIDMRMWQSDAIEPHRKVLRPCMGSKLFVGFKSMPGRPGAGVGHDKHLFTRDDNLEVLHDWCQDSQEYVKWVNV